jgi:hypothetical protein
MAFQPKNACYGIQHSETRRKTVGSGQSAVGSELLVLKPCWISDIFCSVNIAFHTT